MGTLGGTDTTESYVTSYVTAYVTVDVFFD